MGFTAKDVKALREQTGAGMMDCQKALTASEGDMEKAVVWLREKGKADAAKRVGRIASEGLIASYVHLGGKIGVLVEINCETDFVARSGDFPEFCKNMCLQICSSAPRWVRREDIPPEVIEAERSIYRVRAKETGKPEPILDKIADGMLQKWFKEVCLLEQPYVRDPDRTVEDLLKELSAKVKENCSIRRFARFQMGEGLEKRQSNLAAEVAEQLAQAKGA
ncbi:MAG: translation elongation factor Ts [Candidatus Hydrogenedentes bacterium]|nr:translation elongation factor Ts [Candidatus Hydrogenedentota bacterium]